MSSTITTRLDEHQDPEDGSAGVSRSEPGGRAQRRAGAARGGEAPGGLGDHVRELLSDSVVDELLAGARTEQEIAGQGGLLAQLTKRMLERAMEVELTDHLGFEHHAEPPGGTGNTRNGSTPKRLITEQGEVQINTPRDRAGTFEPQIVKKRQRRFEGFDDKILALYSRGMSTRDISHHLGEIYGVEVGRDLISRVTDAVIDDARAWQTRPLEDIYPVVFLDAMVLKIRENATVQRKACYLALGITLDGDRDVLGMWFQDTEGAKFWMQVLSELKQRGVTDILIACVDGLKGFPEAIEAVFPATTVQTCIVHLIRASLKYVPRKHYDQVTKGLRPIYTAINAEEAMRALEQFEDHWPELAIVGRMWRDSWQHVIPFLAFEPEVRRVIYTTNAIEALNRQLRKAIKTKGSFPTEDAALKLIYLATMNAVPQWTRTRGWTKAMLAFKIQFGDRIPDEPSNPPTQKVGRSPPGPAVAFAAAFAAAAVPEVTSGTRPAVAIVSERSPAHQPVRSPAIALTALRPFGAG